MVPPLTPGQSEPVRDAADTAAADAAAWTDRALCDPHGRADKARRVRAMFAAIAPSYDLNNRLHALGLDQTWRRRAVRMAALEPGEVVLDVACGTGDLALAFASAGAGRVLGADFTVPMLELAGDKAARWRWRWQGRNGAAGRAKEKAQAEGAAPLPPCHWLASDAMALPLADASVDVVSIAFGIRNVADPRRALAEFHRVLRPGGRLVILEFAMPTSPPLRWLYQVYFQYVLPRSATLIANDRSGAYRYLPRSVDTFLQPQELRSLMAAVGFESVTSEHWTMGIVACHRGDKG